MMVRIFAGAFFLLFPFLAFASTVGSVSVSSEHFRMSTSKTYPRTSDGSDGPAAERFEQERRKLLESAGPRLEDAVNAWNERGLTIARYAEGRPEILEITKENGSFIFSVNEELQQGKLGGPFAIKLYYERQWDGASLMVEFVVSKMPEQDLLKEVYQQAFAFIVQ